MELELLKALYLWRNCFSMNIMGIKREARERGNVVPENSSKASLSYLFLEEGGESGTKNRKWESVP
jgi:hypothetical protein